MTRGLLLSSILLIPAFAQNGIIQGRVTNEAGEPLKNALVRIQSQSPYAAFYTETDAEGNFVLDNIDPRVYRLTARRTGYQGNGPRAALTVAPGQRLAGISIKLKRVAELIAGRVVDEDGSPMPDARLRVTAEDGTNYGDSFARADGSFVIGLPLGRYYLSAEESMIGTSASFRDLSGPQPGYVVTYFPSTADPSKATLVAVRPGEHVRSLEIRMTKGRLLHVQGTLVNRDTGMPLPTTSVGLRSLTAQGFGQIQRTAPDGSFEFPRIVPGDYVLYEDQGNQNALRLVGREKVTVGGSDIDGLVLTVGPGLVIPGKFTVEGAVDTSMVRLELPTDDPLQPLVYFQLSRKDDGSFSISNLEPDVYRVRAANLPEGTYVKSVRFGDKDVTNVELDLTRDIAGKALEILLSPHAAEITGVMRDAGGKALDDAEVTLRGPGEFSASWRTDESGAFEFHNLAPGEYRIGATLGGTHNKSDFERQAATLTVTEGASVDIAPPVIVPKATP